MKSESKKKSSGKIVIIFMIVVIVGLVAALIFVLNKNMSNESAKSQTQTDAVDWSAVTKNDNTISVPGYEALTFTAGETMQDVALSNPPQNDCYFKISLYLEDETLLWESELIEPGYNSGNIVLNEALDAGNYENAELRYECFKMDEDLTPLNGAKAKLTLVVK